MTYSLTHIGKPRSIPMKFSVRSGPEDSGADVLLHTNGISLYMWDWKVLKFKDLPASELREHSGVMPSMI